jgi:hypothetical protein
MSERKFKELVDEAINCRPPYTAEAVDKFRKACIEAGDTNNGSGYCDLEVAWRTVANEFLHEGRDRQPSDNPLSSLAYYMEMGIYPPPEVLLAISNIFELYMHATGDISLDEAFFGKPHKKRTSYASVTHQYFNLYGKFNIYRRLDFFSLIGINVSTTESLEAQAEAYLKHVEQTDLNGFKAPDVDSFLRGYHRWKKG